MKKYFYSNGNEKQGPCSLEELKSAGINKSTLIWYKGLENWTPAEEIDECKHLFQITLPPIPAKRLEDSSKKTQAIKKWVYSVLTALILLVICVFICEFVFGKLTPFLNFINAAISYTSGKLVYDHLTEKERKFNNTLD